MTFCIAFLLSWAPLMQITISVLAMKLGVFSTVPTWTLLKWTGRHSIGQTFLKLFYLVSLVICYFNTLVYQHRLGYAAMTNSPQISVAYNDRFIMDLLSTHATYSSWAATIRIQSEEAAPAGACHSCGRGRGEDGSHAEALKIST